VRDLRVVDIAREVGTSTATFYQYFRDVQEAVLALAEEAGEELAPLHDLLAPSWAGERGLDRARELLDAFVDSWDAHRAVLRKKAIGDSERCESSRFSRCSRARRRR